jgi:hypothetical protein
MDLNRRTPRRGQLAAKELATSSVEVLAHRPEKKRRRGFSVPLQLAVELDPAEVEFGLTNAPARVCSIGPRRCPHQFRPNGENPQAEVISRRISFQDHEHREPHAE